MTIDIRHLRRVHPTPDDGANDADRSLAKATSGPAGATLDAPPSSTRAGPVRSSLRVELERIAPWAGALRVLPVAVVVIVALALGSSRAALTLGVGANLVAMLSLAGSRVSRPVVVADVVGLGLATFVGAISASDAPLHLILLALWCFGSGMLVLFGLGPATAGVQSVIAFVVFGRFPSAPLGAIELAALVATGAAIESVALPLLRLPPSLRVQRARLARAYAQLASLSMGTGSTPVATAEALDEAADALRAPALFGRNDVRALRSMVDEGRRIRLELVAIAGLRRRLQPIADDDRRRMLDWALECSSRAIAAIAAAVVQPASIDAAAKALHAFALANDALRSSLRNRDGADALETQLLRHLDAMAGQLRAVRSLSLAPPMRLVQRMAAARRTTPGETVRALVATVRADAALLRSDLSRSSSAFRHSIRLAVAVPLAGVIASVAAMPRGYWIAYTVVVVLKPDYSSLFRRGLGRVLGTILGASGAAFVIGGLHPDRAVVVVLALVCAWAAYSLWQASFAIAIAFVTSFVLVLMSTTQIDTMTTAFDRLIDTVVGGAIALGIYVLWPTWSSSDVEERLATLLRAEAAYVQTVLGALAGDSSSTQQMAARARGTRLAFGDAESAIGRSLDEPRSHRVELDFAAGMLAGARRVVQAAHSLRSEVEHGLALPPVDSLTALAAELAASLERIASLLPAARRLFHSTLRELFQRAATELDALGAPPAVVLQLDEIVDAVNTLGAIASGHRGSVVPHHRTNAA